MNTNTTHLIIFSVFQSTEPTAVNFKNHMLVEYALKEKGLNFKEMGGCYKGKMESSFAVLVPWCDTNELIEEISKIAQRYNQESILYVDNESIAYLDNLHGTQEKVGKFTQTPTEEALQQDSYTLDLSTGLYYTIK